MPFLTFGGRLHYLGVEYLWFLCFGLLGKEQAVFVLLNFHKREREKKVGNALCLPSLLGADCTILV